MLKRISKALLFVAGVCASSIAISVEPTMTNPLLSNPRPWCVGRLVFERPAASEISNQRYEFRGEKLETLYNVPLATYEAKVDSLRDELRTKKRIDPGNRNKETNHAWLEKELAPTQHSRVFVYQSSETDGVTLPFDTQGYVYDQGTLFHTVGEIGSGAIGRVQGIYDDTIRRIKARDN